ncbi:Pycsar system effector family protein [Bailinhaonella thermotolerans]|uniref:Pycsar effector protein domain-containing protein n=1 Tax=Bailinhaonella thermotolerans TaxID=1070861 RepID=A0A3A4A026_9ACTN|nr:Pycsar system effector family protein [Bailinhaonella thermotolerans]RJL20185.1 hypothetical protein D5H75_39755 [Bailinhaonella thermotolerans]
MHISPDISHPSTEINEETLRQLMLWEPPRPAATAANPTLQARLDRMEAEAHYVLDAETTTARAELTRVDTKVHLLLGFSGVAFTVVLTIVLTAGMPTPARLLAAAGALGLAAAAAVLLRAIRPVLRTGSGTGLIAYARAADVDELLDVIAEGTERHRAGDLLTLSRLVVTKYAKVRRATDILLIALVPLTLAVLAALA